MKKLFIRILLFAFVANGFAYGAEIKELTKKQQEIVSISAFTARGDLDNLRISLNDGLDSGLTINEIKDVLVQMYAYCGFPRSLNGLNTFMSVVKDRESRGIKDVEGRTASPLPENADSIEMGTRVQTQITGGVSGAIYDFAPAIDKYLKGHLFGDIFASDVIDFQTRELATVAALASMDGVNSQLQAHFKNGMNTGLTEVQMRDLISVIGDKLGKEKAENAEQVLNRYLTIRNN